jgi:hypothetical protein
VGSTLPLRTYTLWLLEFEKTRTTVHGSCLPFGSVHGAEVVAAGTADFGASEVPEAPRLGFKTVLFFPVAVGAIVPTYNLPGVKNTLRFTPQALAGIYLGTITRWNDPAIAGPNPEVKLPARDIVVIHSAEGRGATYIWSDYLSKVSPEWKTRIGRGASVRWPVRWKRQHCKSGQEHRKFDSLRVDGVCGPDWIAAGDRRKRRGQICQREPGKLSGSRVGLRDQRAGRFPLLDHKSGGRARVSDRHLHMVRSSWNRGVDRETGGSQGSVALDSKRRPDPCAGDWFGRSTRHIGADGAQGSRQTAMKNVEGEKNMASKKITRHNGA